MSAEPSLRLWDNSYPIVINDLFDIVVDSGFLSHLCLVRILPCTFLVVSLFKFAVGVMLDPQNKHSLTEIQIFSF